MRGGWALHSSRVRGRYQLCICSRSAAAGPWTLLGETNVLLPWISQRALMYTHAIHGTGFALIWSTCWQSLLGGPTLELRDRASGIQDQGGLCSWTWKLRWSGWKSKFIWLGWLNGVKIPSLNNPVTTGRLQIHKEFKYKEIHLTLNK